MTQWKIIPLREWPHLSVIRDDGGELIGTVSNEYAEAVSSLPEIKEAGEGVLKIMRESGQMWSKNSVLGSFENLLRRIK